MAKLRLGGTNPCLPFLCLQIRVIKQAFYSVNRADRISEMFPKSSPRKKIDIPVDRESNRLHPGCLMIRDRIPTESCIKRF